MKKTAGSGTNNLGVRLFALCAAVWLAAGFFGAGRVSAQSTALRFTPDPASLYLNSGNLTQLDLCIENAVLINAFDIILTYDANIARITSWVSGGFLDVTNGCIIQINNPGYFRLVCTQLNKPGQSGSGSLVRLTFSGNHYGQTALVIAKAELSNKDSQLVIPLTENGQLDVTYQPGVVMYTSLSGSIALQGQPGRAGIPFELASGLYLGQGPFELRSTASLNDNLSLNPLAMDAYPLITSQPRYLNLRSTSGKIIGLLAAPNTLPPLVLLGGDVAQPWGVIDLSDLALTAGSLGQSGNNLSADVNADGGVDARDLAMVAGNYGLNATSAYAGWAP